MSSIAELNTYRKTRIGIAFRKEPRIRKIIRTGPAFARSPVSSSIPSPIARRIDVTVSHSVVGRPLMTL